MFSGTATTDIYALSLHAALPIWVALTSRNERFIDYGPVEATTYARFAVYLGDAARLSPRVLAVVDPQAFWAACMRVDAFVDTLSQLEQPEIGRAHV